MASERINNQMSEGESEEKPIQLSYKSQFFRNYLAQRLNNSQDSFNWSSQVWLNLV